MAYDDQAAVDAAFADLDGLLAERRPLDERSVCLGCGGTHLEKCANPGHVEVYYYCCVDCGIMQPCGAVGAITTPCTRSNYKRIHHWHERVSQLMLCESRIPDADFERIAQRICDGTHTVINKDVIRAVLRSLNMQIYIEKWLQIIQRITGVEPPKPGNRLLIALDDMFTELQRPFAQCKEQGRKNFLNYNYVFCRLFQKLGCAQFSMFFPLIKSRAKLKVLDETWAGMVASIGWEVTPLQLVQPFAVTLEKRDRLRPLQDPADVSAALAATRTVQSKTGFRKSDRTLLRELDRQTILKQRHSCPPEPELQKLGLSRKRLLSARGATLQSRLLSQRRQ